MRAVARRRVVRRRAAGVGVVRAALKEAQAKHMIYDYCVDEKRFKDKELPKECNAD